jgi:hypothetical protein
MFVNFAFHRAAKQKRKPASSVQQKARRTLTVGEHYDTFTFTAKASTLPRPALTAATKPSCLSGLFLL